MLGDFVLLNLVQHVQIRLLLLLTQVQPDEVAVGPSSASLLQMRKLRRVLDELHEKKAKLVLFLHA